MNLIITERDGFIRINNKLMYQLVPLYDQLFYQKHCSEKNLPIPDINNIVRQKQYGMCTNMVISCQQQWEDVTDHLQYAYDFIPEHLYNLKSVDVKFPPNHEGQFLNDFITQNEHCDFRDKQTQNIHSSEQTFTMDTVEEQRKSLYALLM